MTKLILSNEISQNQNLIRQTLATCMVDERIVIKDSEETQMEKVTLLLSSQLNTEFVYAILKGICKFTLLNFTGQEFTRE